MRYEMVFWDLDGTICHSLSYISGRGQNLPQTLVPYEGISELLMNIPRDRQGLITNGYDAEQRNKLQILGLENCFSPGLIFTSEGEAKRLLNSKYIHSRRKERIFDTDNMMLTTQKPQPYMFRRAIQISGVDPKNAIMIGNHWTDILGAQRAGMQTTYINGTAADNEDDFVSEGKIVPTFIVEKGDMRSLEKVLF